MVKNMMSNIKTFNFSELESDHVVSQNQPKLYNFKNLAIDLSEIEANDQKQLRDERSFANKNKFEFDQVVKDHRGFSSQERKDFDEIVEAEVKKRIEKSFTDAYQQGLEQGRADAIKQASNELNTEVNKKITEFESLLFEASQQLNHLYDQNRSNINEFIKRFTKWILLKEIDEKKYLESLLEKLILELNARKNLIVKVGRGNFESMPEIIQAVEQKIGQLSNVRIEIVPEIQHPGIILESENGLIDGSLESVFQYIDKIFEQVSTHE
jgi:flagellar assembly protein FliH